MFSRNRLEVYLKREKERKKARFGPIKSPNIMSKNPYQMWYYSGIRIETMIVKDF